MRRVWLVLLLPLLFPSPGHSAGAPLPNGFGKATWGMTETQFLSAYRIVLAPPESGSGEGVWAVEGPAPGELTVSGAALGEGEIRSVSFGFHPKWGLAIIHIRLKGPDSPEAFDAVLPKWTARYGSPKERLDGPKAVWEDGATHIELTIHRVEPLHPAPTDHLAVVLWSIPLMDKIESRG
jgi:hypothetical protein